METTAPVCDTAHMNEIEQQFYKHQKCFMQYHIKAWIRNP